MKIKYSLNRYKNKRLNIKEFKERKPVLRSFPYIAYIDPTNICPLSCPLCPTGNKSSAYPKGSMSLETFKRIYDQIGQYLYQLHLYNWGEPLLNRRILDMIEYVKKKYNPEIIVSSTLSGLSMKMAEKIAQSDINLLSVSIDGATQNAYEKYRVGGNLERVLNTLKHMEEARQASGLRKPLLRWQFIPMRHNENEIESARKLAKDLGVDFRLHRVRLNICDFEKKETNQILEEREEWMPQNSEYIKLKKGKGLENGCNFLWDTVVFNWNGSIQPCCKIYNYEDVFENDLDKRFSEVWNGPAYIKAREIFNGRRAEKDFICQKCIDHKGAF